MTVLNQPVIVIMGRVRSLGSCISGYGVFMQKHKSCITCALMCCRPYELSVSCPSPTMSLDVHCSLLAHENCACYNANLEALKLQATVANVIILFIWVFFLLISTFN